MGAASGSRQTLNAAGSESSAAGGERAASLGDFRRSAAAIRRALLPNGEISDDASPELRRIRGGMAARDTIQKSLERILRARGELAGEDYVTLRNDRFVIPVRASERRAVQGVVHAASATGQTVFRRTARPSNSIITWCSSARTKLAEIARILAELTARFRRNADHWHARRKRSPSWIRFLRGADLRASSIARMSAVHRGDFAAAEAARHPVLEATLQPQGRAVVPLSLALGGDETVLVISGPNTGGKTVALKTVGLAVLAAQSGIPVAAQSATASFRSRAGGYRRRAVDCRGPFDVFRAHAESEIHVRRATERSLVLVDEMGTGTAPEEGAALAVALLEEFRARRA